MDVKSAFNNVSRGHLVGRLMASGVGGRLGKMDRELLKRLLSPERPGR